MRCRIIFRWDDKASVWIATSDDVPGLVLESSSFDALIEHVKQAVPELLRENGISAQECRLVYTTRREDIIACHD